MFNQIRSTGRPAIPAEAPPDGGAGDAESAYRRFAESGAFRTGLVDEATLRELAGSGCLARVAASSPNCRTMLCVPVYAMAWPLVFTNLTRQVERRRGHHACARSVQDLAPACLDRFHDDVESVIDDLLAHADRPIRNLEAWIHTRLQAATVDGHRRRRGARGALQRPRVPKWLSTALGADPWLVELAGQILVWVGVDATPGTGLWPLDSWTRLRAGLTGDGPGSCPALVEREIELVLAAMRKRGNWYADYVERPFGRKPAPVAAWAAADDAAGTELPPLLLTDPLEAAESELAALAESAYAEILRRLGAGEDPETVAEQVVRSVFGEEDTAGQIDRLPHDRSTPGEHLAALMADPDQLARIVSSVLAVVLSE